MKIIQNSAITIGLWECFNKTIGPKDRQHELMIGIVQNGVTTICGNASS